MKPSLLHSFFSFMVVFSLLVPSVLPFINYSEETLMLIDFSEDEQKKEQKKDLEEKEVFFESAGLDNNLDGIDSGKSLFGYKETQVEVITEIILPPPEFIC
ncbi:MAG: hypothetical protein K0U54_12280 [Bacteroidetes bacterium]|nr:hypothetical protein [Bacteroidota bacterium]